MTNHERYLETICNLVEEIKKATEEQAGLLIKISILELEIAKLKEKR